MTKKEDFSINDFVVDKTKPVDDGSGRRPVLGEVGYGTDGREVATTIIVGANQKQQRVADNPDCFCKIITHDAESHSCYIKCGMSKRLFDPYSPFTAIGVGSMKYEARTGKASFEFVYVPDNIFQIYFRYLETRNQVYFRQCERELYNA